MSPPPLDWQVSKQPEPSEHRLRAEPESQSPTWAYSSLLSHSILLRIKIQLKKKEKKRRKVFVGSATAPGMRGDCTGEPAPSVVVSYEDVSTWRIHMQKPGRTTRFGSLREE